MGKKFMFRGSKVCLLLVCVTHIISVTTSVKILDGKNKSVQHKKDRELSNILNSLFRLQTRHWYDVYSRNGNTRNTTLLIYQQENWQIVADFHDSVTRIQPDTLFLELGLHVQPSEYEMENVMDILFKHYNSIHTVGLFVEDTTWTHILLKRFCSVVDFKWTHIRHTTEWILASRNSNYLLTFSASNLDLCADFFTLVISPEDRNGVFVDRKSRGAGLQSLGNGVWIDRAMPLCDLSKAFRSLSTRRRSSMEGMNIPVGLLENTPRYTEVEPTKYGNHKGFSISLMKIIEEYFGLTPDYIIPSDGDKYGRVHSDGSITGLTGLLARREIAMTCMDFSRTDNRLHVIDYVDIPTLYDPFQILYMLPKTDGGLDFTLLSIIHGDIILMLLAPVVCMLVVGALIHVVTKSCSVVTPEMSVQNLRTLGSFPDHICFHSPRTYVGQSGRILRASWGVFCIIFCAAYSAYLVTTFTIKQPELKLETLEQLLQKSPIMMFGTPKSNSAFMTHLNTTTNKIHQEFWDRVKAYSETHSWIMSPNYTEHLLKILNGNYALVAQFQRGNILQLNVDADFTDLRGYTIKELNYMANLYIGLPQNAFYKDELNALLLRLESTGILNYLREKFINVHTELNISPLEPERSVSLSRVALLLYVTCGGIGLGTICLVIELMYAKCVEWAGGRE